jgi:glycosyltransferase involved in cell wall biosynthesis
MVDHSSRANAPQKLSVIVPVRNGGMTLARCLQGLAESDYSHFEVIVVDDWSTDNTPQIVERSGAQFLRAPQPMGPGGARNWGARHATGEIMVFVDADVVVPPEILRLFAEDFLDDPDLAAVFGSYDDTPARQNFLSQYKNLMHHYVHQISSESAVTFWAGCGAMRKAVFDEFGGFDAEKYPQPSIEDIALGHRLHVAGRKIRLDKRIQAKHLKRWTLRSLLRADIYCRAVPWTKLILESRKIPRDLNLAYASQLSAFLVVGVLTSFVLIGLHVVGLMRLPWLPPLAAMVAAMIALLALNWDVYRFFFRKRGFWFATRVVPAHWFYYLYSSATFALCAAIHFTSSPMSSARRVTKQG